MAEEWQRMAEDGRGVGVGVARQTTMYAAEGHMRLRRAFAILEATMTQSSSP